MNLALRALKQNQIETLIRNLYGDWRIVIDIAIIRLMKARATFNDASLIQEIIQQLSSHFEPKIPLTKVSSIVTLCQALSRDISFLRNVF